MNDFFTNLTSSNSPNKFKWYQVGKNNSVSKKDLEFFQNGSNSDLATLETYDYRYSEIAQTQLDILDRIVQKLDSFDLYDKSFIKFLDGYLYDSPSHQDILCWRSFNGQNFDLNTILSELNNLQQKPQQKSIDYNSDKIIILENKNITQNNQDNLTALYDREISEKIRKFLAKIFYDLLKFSEEEKEEGFKRTLEDKEENRSFLDSSSLDEYQRSTSFLVNEMPNNIHEAKLLDTYEKIRSKSFSSLSENEDSEEEDQESMNGSNSQFYPNLKSNITKINITKDKQDTNIQIEKLTTTKITKQDPKAPKREKNIKLKVQILF